VNGGFAGARTGGFGAFIFDVSPFLKAGENELLLAGADPSDTGEQPLRQTRHAGLAGHAVGIQQGVAQSTA